MFVVGVPVWSVTIVHYVIRSNLLIDPRRVMATSDGGTIFNALAFPWRNTYRGKVLYVSPKDQVHVQLEQKIEVGPNR